MQLTRLWLLCCIWLAALSVVSLADDLTPVTPGSGSGLNVHRESPHGRAKVQARQRRKLPTEARPWRPTRDSAPDRTEIPSPGDQPFVSANDAVDSLSPLRAMVHDLHAVDGWGGPGPRPGSAPTSGNIGVNDSGNNNVGNNNRGSGNVGNNNQGNNNFGNNNIGSNNKGNNDTGNNNIGNNNGVGNRGYDNGNNNIGNNNGSYNLGNGNGNDNIGSRNGNNNSGNGNGNSNIGNGNGNYNGGDDNGNNNIGNNNGNNNGNSLVNSFSRPSRRR